MVYSFTLVVWDMGSGTEGLGSSRGLYSEGQKPPGIWNSKQKSNSSMPRNSLLGDCCTVSKLSVSPRLMEASQGRLSPRALISHQQYHRKRDSVSSPGERLLPICIRSCAETRGVPFWKCPEGEVGPEAEGKAADSSTPALKRLPHNCYRAVST